MKYASFVRLGETCFGVFHQGKIFDLTYQLAGGSSSLKEAIHLEVFQIIRRIRKLFS